VSAGWFDNLTLPGVISVLRAKGISERHLEFGGEGNPPAKKITVPTDARSEFLANRAMGDWAETRLSDSIRQALPEWSVTQYGNTDRIAAGEAGFKERYLSGVEETRRFGKRPDLLLFPSGIKMAEDISGIVHAESEPLVRQAAASIEVRSSKFEALRYMAVRKQQRESGTTGGRETPSFTVKVEDLIIVYRWLERHQVQQSYFQVFFDSVFAINFSDIFGIISSGAGFLIEKPDKSQEKATIMIPITRGLQVGAAKELPHFEAEHRVTKLGRHDAFVVPRGGGFSLDREAALRVLQPRP
jgi:hypothetical protein